MAGREIIGEGEVRVGVNTALAEEGLKRLTNDFDRAMGSMDRRRAQAHIGADITEVDAKIAEVKGKLLELTTDENGVPIKIEDKAAKKEIALLRGELKLLGQNKTELRVDSKQLADANKQMDLSAKKQAEMAKQYGRESAAQARLTETRKKDHIMALQQVADAVKLEQQYVKLSKLRSRQEREGMFTLGGVPGRTKAEQRDLEKTAAELDLVGAKLRQLGRDTDGLDKKDRFGSKLLEWASRMKAVRISMGPFSAKLGTMIAATSTLAPLILSLVGGLSALVGVLGAGLVGATAVASAGLGGLVLSMGGVALVSKEMVGHLKEQVKAAHDYRDAVLKYGKDSEQATGKLEQLQNVTKGISPEARKVVKGIASIGDEWEKLTRPSRKPFFEIAGEGLKTVKALMPGFANETNATFKTLKSSVNPILKELRGAGAKGVMHDLMSNFRDSLPDLIHGLRNVGVIIGNISDEASKFLPEVTGGFDNWTQHLANETGTEHFKHRLDEMINQAGDLLHLFNVAGKAIVLFFGTGAEAGDEMTNSLSRTITRWNEWMRSTEGQHSLHDFFHQSAEDTSNFFGALVPLLATFTKLTYALQPVTSGFLVFANILGKAVTALTMFAPVRPMLEALGITLGAFFVINKAKAWTQSIQSGYSWLMRLMGVQGAAVSETEALTASNLELAASYRAVAASAEGATVATTVGGVGPGGVVGRGAKTAEKTAAKDAGAFGEKALVNDALGLGGGAAGGASASKLSGLLGGGGVEALGGLGPMGIAGGIAGGYFAAEFGAKAIEGITGADLLENQNLLTSLTGGFNTAAAGAAEDAGVQFNKTVVGFEGAVKHMRQSAILGMGGVSAALQRSLEMNPFKKGGSEWRHAAAQAMHGAIGAIQAGMDAGTIKVKAGERQINKLLKQIHIVRGNDPLQLGEAAAASFKKMGQITPQGIQAWVNQLKAMPKGAADQARRSTEAILQAWAKGHPKIEHQVHLLTSHMDAAFGTSYTNIMKTFGNLATGVSTNLEGIVSKVHGTLAELTGSVVNFGAKHGNYGGLAPGEGGGKKGKTRKGEQRGGRLQQGGFTVPGRGDGDQFPFEAEEGGFVLNREASRAAGFQRGGAPVILEPGERYFTPAEAGDIGHGNLSALNREIPRFQLGGEPQLSGSGLLHDTGQAGIHKVYTRAEKVIAKVRKKEAAKKAAAASSGSVSGYVGPPAHLKNLGNNSYVDGHTLAVTALIDKMFGLTMTDGYRDAATAEQYPSGLGTLHHDGDPSNPGATDSAGPMGQMEKALAWSKAHVAGLLEAQIDNVAGYNMHLGFFQNGGSIHPVNSAGASAPAEWAMTMLKAGFPRTTKVLTEGLGVIGAETGGSFDSNPGGDGAHFGAWQEDDSFGSVAERLNPFKSTVNALKRWKADGGFYPAWGRWELEQGGADGSKNQQWRSDAEAALRGSTGSSSAGGSTAKPKGPKAGSVGKGGGVNAPPGSASAKEIANTVVGALHPGKINPELAKLLPKSVRGELKQPGLTGEDRSGILAAYQGGVQTEGGRATTKLERADSSYTKIHEKALAHPENAGLQEADKKAGEADTVAHNVAKKARLKEIKAAKALLVPLRASKKAIQKRIKEISKSLGKKGLKVSERERLIKERSTLFGALATTQSNINEELEIINLEPIPPSALEVATEESIEAGEAEAAEASESAASSAASKPSYGEQLATISGAREDLFNTFAPNITSPGAGTASVVAASGRGGGLFGGGLFGGSGARINPFASLLGGRIGGGSQSGSGSGILGGGVSNTINNFFSAPPADPHTWTKQQAFELQALA